MRIPTDADVLLNIWEVRERFRQFFQAEFTERPDKEQAEIVLANLDLYWVPLVTDKQRDFLTTIYLRAFCGCENERYLDELTQQWVEIEQHTKGCLRLRYPISEDLSDRTLQRRSFKERLISDRHWEMVEEGQYSA